MKNNIIWYMSKSSHNVYYGYLNKKPKPKTPLFTLSVYPNFCEIEPFYNVSFGLVEDTLEDAQKYCENSLKRWIRDVGLTLE